MRAYSEDHLPFAVVSVCTALVFLVLPTFLLILYPTRFFRKCITCCRFRRWHALHTFMEAFQGQYKDGTNGTRDFRIVSALYLIFRIIVLLFYLVNHDRGNHAYCWLAAALILVCTSHFFAILRPYKVNYLNTIDSLLLTLLGIQTMLCLFVIYLPNQKYSPAIGMTAILIMGIPYATLMLYILCFILKKLRILQCLNRKRWCLLGILCWNQHSLTEDNSQNGLNTDSLPDRVVNPDEYAQIIPAVNQNFQSESFTIQARVIPTNTYGIFGD